MFATWITGARLAAVEFFCKVHSGSGALSSRASMNPRLTAPWCPRLCAAILAAGGWSAQPMAQTFDRPAAPAATRVYPNPAPASAPAPGAVPAPVPASAPTAAAPGAMPGASPGTAAIGAMPGAVPPGSVPGGPAPAAPPAPLGVGAPPFAPASGVPAGLAPAPPQLQPPSPPIQQQIQPPPPRPAPRPPLPPPPPAQPVKGLPAGAPPLVISGGVYSADRDRRRAIVNGQVVREGADLGSGLLLEEITPDGVVVGFRGSHYRLMY